MKKEQDVERAVTSVSSWFNQERLIEVTKPVNQLRDDAYIVKEHLLKEKFPDKWNSMSKLFNWRFGVSL